MLFSESFDRTDQIRKKYNNLHTINNKNNEMGPSNQFLPSVNIKKNRGLGTQNKVQ